MTVNALVTGLIVFNLFKVFEKHLGIVGGSRTASIMFVIIESGMALFTIQWARLAISATYATSQTDAEYVVLELVVYIHEMLNVIMSFSHCYFIFY